MTGRVDPDGHASVIDTNPSRRMRGETRRATSRHARARHAFTAADVEMQPIADHETHAAGGLHVGPVPVALAIRHRDERLMRGPRPVKAVAAEADAQIVRLLAIGRLAAERSRRARASRSRRRRHRGCRAPGCTFAPGWTRVERFGRDPRHGLAGRPARGGERRRSRDTGASRFSTPIVVAQAEAPAIAKRIVEKRCVRSPAGPALPRSVQRMPSGEVDRRSSPSPSIAVHAIL